MRAKIGIYTVGLSTYWKQFEGLKDRLSVYNRFISEKIEKTGAEVFNFGIVDCMEKATECGEYFNSNNVDLIFLHCGTYATSAAVVPAEKSIILRRLQVNGLLTATRALFPKFAMHLPDAV